MAHTPGPWNIEEPVSSDDGYEIWAQGPEHPIEVVGGCINAGVMRVEDAHLIAAAPELLHHAKRAMVALSDYARGRWGVNDLLLELSKAIGRAEGEAIPR